MQLRPYQKEASKAAQNWIKKSIEPCVLDLATGCHAKDHPILMFDGTIKPVQDVKVGDAIMGPDSTPRIVSHLHRGTSQMVKVKPTKGEEFTVNEGHIFSIYQTPKRNGDKPSYHEKTAAHFLDCASKTEKHVSKLYRVPVEFHPSDKDLPFSPWHLGFLIGDGCLTTAIPSFCTPDPEVVEAFTSYIVDELGCRIKESGKGVRTAPVYYISDPKATRKVENRVRAILSSLGMQGKSAVTKSVPFIYKTASRENRLEIIAGMIDSDGHLSRSGYDWISKSEQLADDMVYLCRSVGLAAYKKQCIKGCQNGFSATYYRVSISGESSIIPCRIERKKAQKRNQIKNALVTGFKLERVQEDDYYGFQVDKDHLYVDGHFMVHHNSGKSLIVADIARWLNKTTGKSVLCLAPSKELVEQNHAKYQAYGERAGFYSASVGKSLRYPVVFGTPVSVKNDILRFKGGNFSLVIIDECHQITPTIKEIIEHLREANPNLRVIGLTATPYRMGEGYIYRYQADGTPLPLEAAACPYFNTCVYSIGTRDLIKMGFLVPVYTDPAQVQGYDASSLKLRGGRFKQAEVDKVFVGRGRLTSDIVADVVSKAADKNGVIFFAANVQHAEEIAECLPRELTGIITSKTKKDVRAKIIKDFCAMRIKYLINVAVLTTGFDAPHIDVIALLRLSESASLIQQIIGRGLRLSPETGKDHCLFLDYAGNIERHGLEGDLFAPKIQARAAGAGELIDVVCPLCSRTNSFKARPNKEGYHLGQDGYFYLLDSDNPSPVLNEDGKPIPSHFGRKCLHQWPDKSNPGKFVDCSYRWTGKECDECGHESDIAARFCENCRAELVDPNEKLKIEHSQAISDPFSPMTHKVNFFDARRWVAKSGKIMLKCDYVTDTIRIGLWYCPEFSKPWNDLCRACFGRHIETVDDFLLCMMTDSEYQSPKTLTAYKHRGSGYYRVLGHNLHLEVANAS